MKQGVLTKETEQVQQTPHKTNCGRICTICFGAARCSYAQPNPAGRLPSNTLWSTRKAGSRSIENLYNDDASIGRQDLLTTKRGAGKNHQRNADLSLPICRSMSSRLRCPSTPTNASSHTHTHGKQHAGTHVRRDSPPIQSGSPRK